MSNKKYITLDKITDTRYGLKFENGSNLGEFLALEDGYFYWFPAISGSGAYASYILVELSEKLIKLNKAWDLKIKKEFGKNDG